MENLSPHKKFPGTPTIKGVFSPFYQHAWPKDLPAQCQICGSEFRTNLNLQIDGGRVALLLKTIAYWSFLPCLILAPVLTGLFPGMYDGLRGNHQAWLFFFLMFAPPPLIFLASFLTPIRRRVECEKCGWNHSYPPAKHTPIPPAENSP